MNGQGRSDFVFQLAALLTAVILVHTLYVVVVRPTAIIEARAEAEQLALDPEYVPQRSLFVVIKDFEQETCFVLMLWATAIMALKARDLGRERRAFREHQLELEPGAALLPEDSLALSRRLEHLDPELRDRLLPRAMRTAVGRFRATGSVNAVAEAGLEVCDAESDRLDSEMSMVRYIAWAIPSIGFIGTVRGIGQALGQAHQAVSGDITGVTESLGVAFNSTFIALVLSILLMFLMHQLQLGQERLVLDTKRHLTERLLPHLKSV